MSESTYDEVAEAYDQWVDAPTFDDPSLTELVGNVTGQPICVVACGQGREARWLAGLGAQVTALDISAGLLAIARRHEDSAPLGIRYLQGSAHTLEGVETHAYDGVVCHMALMDIPELEPTIDSVVRVIRPGGWFVFSIVHPCFKTPAAGELVDHVDGSIRRTIGKYYVEGYWPGPGAHSDRLPVGAYHRTLSTYVNTLAGKGFAIEAMREPKLDTPIWREVPCVLYLRSRFPGGPATDTGTDTGADTGAVNGGTGSGQLG